MKNSSVRTLIKEQFNIDSDIEINVIFLSFVDNVYNFMVEWWENDTVRKQCNLSLPQLKYYKQNMNNLIKEEFDKNFS
jgi:hypothetical protein